jgi:hypothetical protein
MTNKLLMAMAVPFFWASAALATPDLPTARAAMNLVLGCGEHGAACTSNAQCCSEGTGPGDECQTLPNGSKVCCSEPQDDCAADTDCCLNTNATCNSQASSLKCCVIAHAACQQSSDCCLNSAQSASLPCDAASKKCCDALNATCSASSDCCSASEACIGRNLTCCAVAQATCHSAADCCAQDESCPGGTKTHASTCCYNNNSIPCTANSDCCSNAGGRGGSCNALTGGTLKLCCKARGSSCTAASDCCAPSNVYGGIDDCIDGYCCGSAGATCTANADCCYPFTCLPGGPNGTNHCVLAGVNQSPVPPLPACTGNNACWSGHCEDPDPGDGQGNRCWARQGQLCPGLTPGPSMATPYDNDCEGFLDHPAGWVFNYPPQRCVAKDSMGRFVCCAEPGYGCPGGSGDCCGGNCVAGTCACNAAQGACHSELDCCNFDQQNLCTATVPGASGTCCYIHTSALHCAANADCCSGTCNNPGAAGSCACGPQGTRCAGNADCCVGLTCSNATGLCT